MVVRRDNETTGEALDTDALAKWVGSQILQARKRADLAQSHATPATGMTQAGFSKLESGESLLSLKPLLKLPVLFQQSASVHGA